MSDNALVSVIIPVYGVEKYLNKCVESVVDQTYTNLEIILVDDGSPDNCPAMCDAWAEKDSRVKVVHKPNGGLSDARNKGIDVSSGEYLTFIDSDDYIAPDYVEKLHRALVEHGADVAMCNYRKVDENMGVIPEDSSYKLRDELLSGREVLDKYFLFIGPRTTLTISCSKLYKKLIFADLRFPVGRLHEDEFMVFPIYTCVKKVVAISDALYMYLQRDGSIVNSSFSGKRMFDICSFWEERLSMTDPKSTLHKKAAVGYALTIFGHIDRADITPEQKKRLCREYIDCVKYVFDRNIDIPVLHKVIYFAASLFPAKAAEVIHRLRPISP